MTPMRGAQACRRSTSNEPDRNRCIIDALEGRARTDRELGFLATTQQASGRTAGAVRTMRMYIQRYPHGQLLDNFQRYIDSHR